MASRLALLIDGENIAARYFPEIARHCLKLGDLRGAQVFADFSEGRRAGWLDVARDFGVQPVMQLSRKGKNSADIAMAVGAMDVLIAGSADTICLVSSDRDFIPLAQRLRMSRIGVVGIGLEAHDKVLADSCDQFFLLTPTEKRETKPDQLAAPPLHAPNPKQISTAERKFLIGMIGDLCRGSGSSSIQPAIVGMELRKRNGPLANRIGGDKLIKRLVESGVAVAHGEGPAKLISPVASA